jgi:Co/Zn/Cd efflux system component
MTRCCSDLGCASGGKGLNSPAWRRALWGALALNGAMFVAEIAMGIAAGSASLQADALDFLGDTTIVAGLTLAWRARAALFKGVTVFAFAVWIVAVTIHHAWLGTLPDPIIMGPVGVLALLVNVVVAAMLFRFRSGDANMRSVWICSRNDAIGNLAVLAAAAGVFRTGAGWPDLIVAAIMSALGLSGGWAIMRSAVAELRVTAVASLHAGHASY